MSIKEKQWERVQERAFTQWLNQTLQEDGLSVSDLRLDIQDGLKLISFFQLLTGKKVKKSYDKHPKNRIAKINNLAVALDFLEANSDIVNPGCCAEDIIDAESKGIKMILGLLWTLFRRYKMREAGSSGAKEEDAILEWVRKTTEGYNGVDIKNFRVSFLDGKAFLAIVHAYNKEDPDFDYSQVSQLSTEEVLNTAFKIAEEQLGVSKLLDVQDFLDKNVDERSIALYTTLLFSAFKAREKITSLQGDLAQKSDALTIESKSKEELIKLNNDLSLQAAQLQKALDDEHEHAASLDQLCEDLKKEHIENQETIERLKKELAELQSTFDNLSAQNDNDLEEKLANAVSEREATEKQLSDEKNESEHLGFELEKLREDAEKKKFINEENTESLIKRSKKAKNNTHSLKVVRSNLDQHYDDLTRWQRYLDGNASTASSDEYMLLLKDELKQLSQGKTSEEAHNAILETLSKRFAEENAAMEKLLGQQKELEKVGK